MSGHPSCIATSKDALVYRVLGTGREGLLFRLVGCVGMPLGLPRSRAAAGLRWSANPVIGCCSQVIASNRFRETARDAVSQAARSAVVKEPAQGFRVSMSCSLGRAVDGASEGVSVVGTFVVHEKPIDSVSRGVVDRLPDGQHEARAVKWASRAWMPSLREKPLVQGRQSSGLSHGHHSVSLNPHLAAWTDEVLVRW